MKRQVWFERLGFLSLFLTLISLAVFLTINARFIYVWDVKHLDILNYTNLDQTRLLKNYDELMRFLNFPWVKELSLADFPMSIQGRAHFYDVKKLFMLDYTILFISLFPSAYFLYYLNKTKQKWRLIQPFQWGMGLPVLLALLMSMGFDAFFIKFHELFFNNDDWLFDPITDPIINVLPEQYFMHCFIFFFFLIEIFFAIGIWLGKRELKQQIK